MQPHRFDIEEPFQLTTDFSSKAISAILSQVQDGQERLIAAVGRKTTAAEKNYASYKGKMAAVIFGCRKFNPILSYHQFVLNTDSSTLLQIKNLRPQSSMLIQWTEELAALEFEAKHRPGQLNTNADALSHREDEFMPPPTDQEEEELPEPTDIGIDGAPQVALPQHNLDPAQWLQNQLADPVLVEVRAWLQREERPNKEELRGRPQVYHRYTQVLHYLTAS
ncbi:MAG: hypothetical protein GY696_14085 [Gammaproteobacteria bacterium]|nr:hypothetical protein [Gammaproteobacteria bacterium]